jgi:hypothetical protein
MRKILVLTANAKSTARLRLDQEVRDIEEGIKRSTYRNEFKVTPRWAVRPRDIQRALLEENPQIIHFSGHGEGSKGLAFENDAGEVQLIDSYALADLFGLFADQVKCVLLNGCYSEVQAKAIVEHIDYVIGMSQSISDIAAIEFAISFYDALGAGKSYEFAYKLACNAIQLSAQSVNLTSSSKFLAVDEPKKDEHMIPVLLRRKDMLLAGEHQSPDIDFDTAIDKRHRKSVLEASIQDVEAAGEARIVSLSKQISEKESKLNETLSPYVQEALSWLKKNEFSLSQDAKNYALAKYPNKLQSLSIEDQDDFRWELEKYIESVYFSILSDSFELVDEPSILPSIQCAEIYAAGFELIKKKIPNRLHQTAQELVFQRFDYLLTRLFVV